MTPSFHAQRNEIPRGMTNFFHIFQVFPRICAHLLPLILRKYFVRIYPVNVQQADLSIVRAERLRFSVSVEVFSCPLNLFYAPLSSFQGDERP